MAATIVLGAQWGDEGKGKLVDILSRSSSLCCRAQGGNNAGHTIVADGIIYDFHILPSGLLNPSCINLIGAGCVVHVPSLFAELKSLQDKGLDTTGRIFVADRAHVVFDLHQLVDGLEEGELGGKAVGTTKKGIGPAYACKASRSGVRMGELADEKVFARKLRSMAEGYRKRYGDRLVYDVEEEIDRLKTYLPPLLPLLLDPLPLLKTYTTNPSTPLLIEGANALMLDLDWGTYPYVTSSSTGLGGIFTGLALSPLSISSIIGVVKSYTTRVGAGPFPTESTAPDAGAKLQRIGREWGVTTGRQRRCGWLDLVVLRHSCRVNHYTSLCLTKLDVLDSFPEIKVATGYELDGHLLDEESSYLADLDKLGRVKVIYEVLPGWEQETTGCTSWDDLPRRAREYVLMVEKAAGVHVGWVGTGPGRESMVVR